MKYLDSFLNSFTTYRLTLYVLIGLVFFSIILSFLGILNYNGIDIILETLISVSLCYFLNLTFSKIFNIPVNTESSLITALILTLIIPVKFPDNSLFLILSSVLAISSKYLLVVNKRHVFNPAAAGVVAAALIFPSHFATWWIGTPPMLLPCLIGGFLIIRKIRRENSVLFFLAGYLIILGVFSLINYSSLLISLTSLENAFTHSALIFFATIMLTEPQTSPTTKTLQNYFSLLVALLYSTPQIHLSSLTFTPEISLCLANVLFFLIAPNYRLNLNLAGKLKLSPDTWAFIFDKDKEFKFIPGQYVEWTLPHQSSDNRGVRRYFSLASSPSEDDLMVVVRVPEKPSSYKKNLFNLSPGQKITASGIAGDFTLPNDCKKPLVFLAGGIGIAPFRSMVQYLIDKNQKSDITLFYSAKGALDILFKDTFKEAQKFGIKTIITLTDKNVPENWNGETGFIDEKMIKKYLPDFKARTFYISGPALMVENYEDMLRRMGVSKVITDYFPGYTEKR